VIKSAFSIVATLAETANAGVTAITSKVEAAQAAGG
jgi:hypothetical protein